MRRIVPRRAWVISMPPITENHMEEGCCLQHPPYTDWTVDGIPNMDKLLEGVEKLPHFGVGHVIHGIDPAVITNV